MCESSTLEMRGNSVGKPSEKAYNYDEAIDLTGSGRYNLGLLATTALALLAMATDMFGFAIVVTLSSCDLHLNQAQKSILVSMPFIGPVITAYTWGYISDTRGRRLSLIVGMMGSFLLSTLSAFSPNWIVMAVLKLFGTCLLVSANCSCAQSATYALLGESCPSRIKNSYMLIMTSIIHLGSAVYFISAYLIGNLNFSYDLGLVTFMPWRLLVLVLALPLGIAGISLWFFYESPKFLLNAGREEEALDVLRHIFRRNGGQLSEYPVYKLVLVEDGNVKHQNNVEQSLWKSMVQQTLPLFKPPLLQRTLLLYYLIVVIYSSSSSMYMWLPFLATAFSAPSGTSANGLCGLIEESNSITVNPDVCTVDQQLMMIACLSSCANTFLNILMSLVASWKKVLMITITSCCGVWAILTGALANPNAASVFYCGILTGGMAMGPLFAYFVELFPTSFRGMAACLGVMVARASSIIGVNVVGPLITTQCSRTFYGFGALLFSGALMSLLLPTDRPKKTS